MACVNEPKAQHYQHPASSAPLPCFVFSVVMTKIPIPISEPNHHDQDLKYSTVFDGMKEGKENASKIESSESNQSSNRTRKVANLKTGKKGRGAEGGGY